MKHNMRQIAAALLMTALWAVAPAHAQDEPPERNGDRREAAGDRPDEARDGKRQDESSAFADHYAGLLETNIFLRDRRPKQAEPSGGATTRPQTAPAPPETLWVLSGVVFEEGEFRAYFENVKTGEVVRAIPGDAIATGRITELYIDAIGYQGAGEIVWVEIGRDLTGAVPAALSGPAVADAAAPANAAQPDGAAKAGAGSIEERLRQRRLQEKGAAGVTVVEKGDAQSPSSTTPTAMRDAESAKRMADDMAAREAVDQARRNAERDAPR